MAGALNVLLALCLAGNSLSSVVRKHHDAGKSAARYSGNVSKTYFIRLQDELLRYTLS
jgi:hypothetical protein